MIQIKTIKGRRLIRDVPRTEPAAELRLKFYGTATVDVRIKGNDSSSPLTINVDRDELLRAVLGQITAGEMADTHVESGQAMVFWRNLVRRLGG